ncbi:MAG: hypothetical protein Q9209_003884 [Squamulea sp. 1 TL-2023]
MLTSAKAQLDREIAQKGSAHSIGYGLVVIEDEVQVFFNSGPDFTIGDGSAAMQGIITMITSGILETKEMVLDLSEGENEKFLGSLQISKQMFNRKRLGAVRARLNPKNYRIPGTGVTVSLNGERSDWRPLPEDHVIGLLVSAQNVANNVVQRQGEGSLIPDLWSFEQGGLVGIDVSTTAGKQCKYKTLVYGIQGLIDLMTEPGGIGAVAARFVFAEQGHGGVAYGQLRRLPDAVRDTA